MNKLVTLPTSKGPVERKVMRIVTPGTVSDDNLLEQHRDNLLTAVYQQNQQYGIATIDISSGRFSIIQVDSQEALLAELERLQPAEMLYAESSEFNNIVHRTRPDSPTRLGV